MSDSGKVVSDVQHRVHPAHRRGRRRSPRRRARPRAPPRARSRPRAPRRGRAVRVDRRQALPVAARPHPRRRALPVAASGGGFQRARLGRGRHRLVVPAAVPRLRGRAVGRLQDWGRRREPARRGHRPPRGRPVLPLVHLPLPPVPVRRARPGVLPVELGRPVARVRRRARHRRLDRRGLDRRDHRRHRHQHRPRTRPQDRRQREVAVQGRARHHRLRSLLRRAQPWASRARRHPRGSRQRAFRPVVLGVPAAQCVGIAEVRVVPREGTAGPPGTRAVDPAQRQPQRLAHDRRVYGALIAVFGWRSPRGSSPRRSSASPAGGRQLPEHYGLLRQKTSSGRYQRCRPEHS